MRETSVANKGRGETAASHENQESPLACQQRLDTEIKATIFSYLKGWNTEAAVDLLKSVSSDRRQEILSDPEVREAVRQQVICFVQSGEVEAAAELCAADLGYTEEQAASDPGVREAIKQGLIEHVRWLATGATQQPEVFGDAIDAFFYRDWIGFRKVVLLLKLLKSRFGYTENEALHDPDVRATVARYVVDTFPIDGPRMARFLLCSFLEQPHAFRETFSNTLVNLWRFGANREAEGLLSTYLRYQQKGSNDREVWEGGKQAVILFLRRGLIDDVEIGDVAKFLKTFPFAKVENSNDPEIKNAAKEALLFMLREYNREVFDEKKVTQLVDLGFGYTTADARQDSEVRNAVRYRFLAQRACVSDWLQTDLGYTREDALRDPEVEKVEKENFLTALEAGYYSLASSAISPDFAICYTQSKAVNDPDAKQATKQGVLVLLEQGRLHEVDELLRAGLGYTKEDAADDPDTKPAARQGFLVLLQGGGYHEAQKLLTAGFGYTQKDAANDPEVRKAAKRCLIVNIEGGIWSVPEKLLTASFGYTREHACTDPDVIETVRQKVLGLIQSGHTKEAGQFLQAGFGYTRIDALRDPEIREAIRQLVVRRLQERQSRPAQSVLEHLGFTREVSSCESELGSLTKQLFIDVLHLGEASDAVSLLGCGFGYDHKDATQDPVVGALVRLSVIARLRDRNTSSCRKLLNVEQILSAGLGYSKEDASRDRDVRLAVRQGSINGLALEGVGVSCLLTAGLGYTTKDLSRDRAARARVRESVIDFLEKGHVVGAKYVLEAGLGYRKEDAARDPSVKAAVRQGVIDSITRGDVLAAKLAVDADFGYSRVDAARDPSVKAAVRQRVINSFKCGDVLAAKLALEAGFGYSRVEAAQDPQVKEVIRNGRGELICYYINESTLKMAWEGRAYADESVVRKAVFEGDQRFGPIWGLAQLNLITLYYPEQFVAAENFHLSEKGEDGLFPELKKEGRDELARWAVLKKVSLGEYQQAEYIYERLPSHVTGIEIIGATQAGLAGYEAVFQQAPRLREALARSPQLGFSLCRVSPKNLLSAITAAPFLIDALQANPKHGPKLFVRYLTLGTTAQEKIRTLYEAKAAILKENPDSEPNSWEFRQWMQEKLLAYGRNREIIKASKQRGINTEAWLAHDGFTTFVLNRTTESRLASEQIVTPLKRTRETIEFVAGVVKEELKKEAADLSKTTVSIALSGQEKSELEAKIAGMREALERARAQGRDTAKLQEGIKHFEERLSRKSSVSLYPLLTSEVARFEILKEQLEKQSAALVSCEERLTRAHSEKTVSGDSIVAVKVEISSAKKDLVDILGKLDQRSREIGTGYQSLLSGALGNERAQQVAHSIKQRTAEGLEHLSLDCDSICRVLEGRGESRASLNGQPMSAFIWSRNPDTDLYTGNYSPCCVSIEGSNHGAESPIADYVTDLGMHVLHIWDEAHGHPVVAAWLFLGENKEGETALVIDNVEANTDYSGAFPDLLQEQAFSYLTEYARALNVDKLVLGKSNNDIPTPTKQSSLREEGSGGFTKIGGYNSRARYFLEGENTSVKLIWQRSDDAGVQQSPSAEAEKRVKKVIYSDIGYNPLGPSTDFSKIARIEAATYPPSLREGELELMRSSQAGNAEQFSFTVTGKNPRGRTRLIGYLLCERGKTDEGEPCLYISDLAVHPSAQGQGIGWGLFRTFVQSVAQAAKTGAAPDLIDLHMRAGTIGLLEKHADELAQLGLTQREELTLPGYYGEGEDAVYRVYRVGRVNA
jgi:ribosomal protein S18 acetylase RimI-like enzyme